MYVHIYGTVCSHKHFGACLLVSACLGCLGCKMSALKTRKYTLTPTNAPASYVSGLSACVYATLWHPDGIHIHIYRDTEQRRRRCLGVLRRSKPATEYNLKTTLACTLQTFRPKVHRLLSRMPPRQHLSRARRTVYLCDLCCWRCAHCVLLR